MSTAGVACSRAGVLRPGAAGLKAKSDSLRDQRVIERRESFNRRIFKGKLSGLQPWLVETLADWPRHEQNILRWNAQTSRLLGGEVSTRAPPHVHVTCAVTRPSVSNEHWWTQACQRARLRSAGKPIPSCQHDPGWLAPCTDARCDAEHSLTNRKPRAEPT